MLCHNTKHIARSMLHTLDGHQKQFPKGLLEEYFLAAYFPFLSYSTQLGSIRFGFNSPINNLSYQTLLIQSFHKFYFFPRTHAINFLIVQNL